MEQHPPGHGDDAHREEVPLHGEAPPPDISGIADQWLSSHGPAAENGAPGKPAGPPVLAVAVGDDPAPRRVRLPLLLFIATCVSTFWSGAAGWPVGVFVLPIDWGRGLLYMTAVMGILLAHEMGHFLMTLRYGISASWPFFIPMPLPPIGTMGAVIAMQHSQADRKQLFDIGLAGPLAGLLVCVPVLCLGIYVAEPGYSPFQQPLLTQMLAPWIRPDLSPRGILPNPLLMAGWVGLLVTGLNMMPISQLDGGHVTYALFRRGAHLLAYAFFFVAIVFVVWKSWMNWVLMLALVALIGVEHPPTANDRARLGPLRVVLGILSLVIPVLCFPPQPIDERLLALAETVKVALLSW